MALTQIQDAAIAMGKALSQSELDAINAAATQAAAVLLFEAATPFVEIPQVSMIGSFGLQQSVQNYPTINTKLTAKITTTRDAGDFELEAQYHSDIQILQDIMAASALNFNRAFRLIFNDEDPAVGSTPTIVYFAGLMAGYTIETGGVDNIALLKTKVALNTIPAFKLKN